MGIFRRFQDNAEAALYGLSDATENPKNMAKLKAEKQKKAVKKMSIHEAELLGSEECYKHERRELIKERDANLRRANAAHSEGNTDDELYYRAVAEKLSERISIKEDMIMRTNALSSEGMMKLENEKEKLYEARVRRNAIEDIDNYTGLTRESNRMSMKAIDVDDDMDRLERKARQKMYKEEAHYDILNESEFRRAKNRHYDRVALLEGNHDAYNVETNEIKDEAE